MRTNNQLQFVSFEQAEALKDLGFNWPTRDFYYIGEDYEYVLSWDSRLFSHNGLKGWDYYSAPTVSLGLQWVREEKDLLCGIYPSVTPEGMAYHGSIIYKQEGRTRFIDTGISADYAEVESRLLDACIDLLNKKGGEK